MKTRIVAFFAVAALAASAHGQGVLLHNLGNAGDQFATSNGRVFMPDGSLFNGLLCNVGVTVFGGPTPGSLTPIGTWTALTDPKGYTGADWGQFVLGTPWGPESVAATVIPGVVPGGVAWLRLQIWFDGTTSLFPSYAAAMMGGGLIADTGAFANPTSNPTGAPPAPASSLIGMPSVTLIPEPQFAALVGIGGLLLFSRRHK